MLNEAFRRLEHSCPWLVRALGGRPDLQVPAIGFSVLVHAAILSAFGVIGYAAHSQAPKQLDAAINPTTLADFATLDDRTALTEIDDTVMKPEAGAFAPTIAPLISEPVDNPALAKTSNRRPIAAPDSTPSELTPPVSLASASLTLPGAPRLDSMIAIQGTGAEHVDSVEGAVDRVSVEILRRLEKGRTLVVWAFDASGSLLAERKRLAKYIDGVYAHIRELDRDELATKDGLMTAVVAFGKDRKVLAEPTSDAQEIISAIEAVPLDETGVESTFQTVGEIARKFGRFRKDKNEYKTVCIVVTDEVGDDEEKLEAAIGACKNNAMPVYVLGSPALFGRVEGYMDYTDPKTKQTFRHIAVRQGPESQHLEGIKLPFWYDGPQYDYMDSGFGPWALSRLAGATGGIYFITRLGTATAITFDPVGMKEYKPDWSSRDQFEAAVGRDPLRQAVMEASRICQQNLPQPPALTFPSVDSPAFKERMFESQETVARLMYTVDEALAPITAVVKKRDHETSRRWQAHYDLIRGRLLAMKLRCYEYNWACARMKKDPQKFKDPKHNAWRLVPDPEVKSSEKAAAAAKEARALLERVVDQHAGTPWALLAQRELKDPFGFKWVETYVPPPPKPTPAQEAARKRAKPPAPATPPPPPPKL